MSTSFIKTQDFVLNYLNSFEKFDAATKEKWQDVFTAIFNCENSEEALTLITQAGGNVLRPQNQNNLSYTALKKGAFVFWEGDGGQSLIGLVTKQPINESDKARVVVFTPNTMFSVSMTANELRTLQGIVDVNVPANLGVKGVVKMQELGLLLDKDIDWEFMLDIQMPGLKVTDISQENIDKFVKILKKLCHYDDDKNNIDDIKDDTGTVIAEGLNATQIGQSNSYLLTIHKAHFLRFHHLPPKEVKPYFDHAESLRKDPTKAVLNPLADILTEAIHKGIELKNTATYVDNAETKNVYWETFAYTPDNPIHLMNIDTLITNADAYWFGYIVFHALKEVMAAKNKHWEVGTNAYPQSFDERYKPAHKAAIMHDIRYYMSIFPFDSNNVVSKKKQVFVYKQLLDNYITKYFPIEDNTDREKEPSMAYRDLNHDTPIHSEIIDNVTLDYGENNYFVTYEIIETGNKRLKPITLLKIMQAWNHNSSLPGTLPENNFQVRKIFILKILQNPDYYTFETYIREDGAEATRAIYDESSLISLFKDNRNLPPKTISSLLQP